MAGFSETGVTELASSLFGAEVIELTGIGHELKWAAEISVAGRCASTHVENIGRERGEALDVCVPRGGFYDAVASFILILRTTDKRDTDYLKGFLTNSSSTETTFPVTPLTFS